MEYPRKDNFLIIKNLKKFIIDLEKILINFPKKDILTRDMMYNDTLEILELIYIANYEKKLELKHQYQLKALAKINKIDFYLERAYHLKYITEKQCNLKVRELLKINKMIYSWCQNESSNN